MAATDKPHRNQKTLDKVFAVSCILMLASVIWMMVADYNREYKNAGRLFRDVESVLNERQMLAQLPDKAEVDAAYKHIEDMRKARDQKKNQVKARDQELTAARDTAVAHFREVKADFDSKSSFYNIEVSEYKQEGISKEVRAERKERVEARKRELDQLQADLTDAQKTVDELDVQYRNDVTGPVADAENDLSNAQDALKKLTGNFDRFAKQTVQKEWGFGDSFRSLPILDAFESPTKIKQIVLADLPIEYGSFKYVTRYDRCASCHLAIDRKDFNHRALTKLTRTEIEAREARQAAVKAAVNDILATLDSALSKGDHDKLRALESAVDKGDVVTKVQAYAPGSPAPPPPPPPAPPPTMIGKITKVETDKITVQGDDGKETTFSVPTDAFVTIDDAPDKLEKIKPDSRVVVLKGDDADPLQEIGVILSGLRDPLAPDPVLDAAIGDPAVQAALVRVQEENEDFREAQSLPKKLEIARRILQERKDKGEDLGFEPGNLPSHARTVALTPGQITQFAVHPRLDLFVDSNSPHPMEKFGCSICHAGQGSATDFQLSAHTPADAGEQHKWEDSYHWHATHDWEFPMLSNRFTESSCLKCHHEVTDLVRQGNKEEAPKLLRGFNLVRENGCFGCHEIAGIKSAREVGPDLRLEPSPALEWLSPTDQDRAKADPTNPPGAFRKVGPSLRRIAEKTNEEWARRWIQSPRGFRPDTKMPHFYNLSNDSPDVLPGDPNDDQKGFPAAEIHSIAHYLFAESSANLKGADTYRKFLEERIKDLQDRLQYSPLEDKERKELADATHKLADLSLLSAPPKAAKINALASGLHEAQNGLLERYPEQADLEQKIAESQIRIVKLLAADLAEDGHEDADLKTKVDGLTTEFTKQADRSSELARKYGTSITPDEVKELAGVKEQRDKAFKDLWDKAYPALQTRGTALQNTVKPLQAALDAAQDKVKKAPADKEAQNALGQAKTDLEQPKKEAARTQNEIQNVDKTKSELQTLTGQLAALVQVMDALRLPPKEKSPDAKDVFSLATQLEKEGQAIPMKDQLFDAEGEPVADLPPEPDMNHQAERLAAGRRLFSERGCLACHVHNGVREKGTNPGDPPPLPDEAANFAPDLSRVAYKIAPKVGDAKEDAAARRRWLVQWVMNPNIYHPRTRMPITHLSKEQACDVADWLLSQKVNEDDLKDWKDPETPDPKTLVALARLYLGKAPGMTGAKVDEFLPKDALDANRKDDERVAGLSQTDFDHTAPDADEASLVDAAGGTPKRVLRIQKKDLPGKLEWYIGKKAIGRLGCYGCHDLPGFETAKPIGTALNDWGKKDPERLAFEDADAYAREHYNIVESRDDADNKARPNPKWKTEAGKEPYEKVFYDALEHHTREGFLHQKLTEPRSFDYNRIRAWDDRLRMPQFRFARSRPRPGEAEAAYAVRQEREEAEAREAVMTFILGLVAEPIPLKYVNAPAPDRLAEVQGRKVLEKFNCIGCHQVRPGVYEVKSSKATLAALERAYQSYVGDEPMDHVFAGHNAWTGAPSVRPDRLTVYATQAQVQMDGDTKRDALKVRLTTALHFTNSDGIARDIPAGNDKVFLPPEDVVAESPPFGGAFADLLSPKGGYLAVEDSTNFNEPDKARSGLPPPLVREGERVQPKWLYQFLLDPQPVRPVGYMKLRMPKFNMSSEEATALVNYFGAADRLSNPGAGLTTPYLVVPQTEKQYWRDRAEEYRKRLQEGGVPAADRAAKLIQGLVDPLQKSLDAAAAEVKAKNLMGDDLAKKNKEMDALKEQIQRLKDWSDELVKEEGSDDAYAADAYRLTANPTVCLQCHNVGAFKTATPKGPDLLLAADRLRPEWTAQWIGNPARMFAYNTIMPQNFPNNKKTDYNEYFMGQPIDRVRAARDVLMDLPRLEALPANRQTRKAILGEK